MYIYGVRNTGSVNIATNFQIDQLITNRKCLM